MENQPTKPPSILIVEQDPLILTGISAILDQKGYRCFLSRDLSVAEKAVETLTFDLFVLSIGDDVSEGEAMANRLHAYESCSDVPIIFVAPRFENSWIGRLNAVGGVYCIPRPLDPYLLMDLVDRAVWMPHLALARLSPPKAHFSNQWVRL